VIIIIIDVLYSTFIDVFFLDHVLANRTQLVCYAVMIGRYCRLSVCPSFRPSVSLRIVAFRAGVGGRVES